MIIYIRGGKKRGEGFIEIPTEFKLKNIIGIQIIVYFKKLVFLFIFSQSQSSNILTVSLKTFYLVSLCVNLEITKVLILF